MITITDGVHTLTVTKGAYQSMYAPQGWGIVRTDEIGSKNDDFGVVFDNKEITQFDPENENFQIKTEPFEPENDETEDEDEIDFSEIPLSQLTVPQLKLYAKQLGVEVNTDSARQLRNQIKKVLGG